MIHSLCVKIEGDDKATDFEARDLVSVEGFKGARTGGEAAGVDDAVFDVDMIRNVLDFKSA